jgi:hypothetical protein
LVLLVVMVVLLVLLARSWYSLLLRFSQNLLSVDLSYVSHTYRAAVVVFPDRASLLIERLPTSVESLALLRHAGVHPHGFKGCNGCRILSPMHPLSLLKR